MDRVIPNPYFHLDYFFVKGPPHREGDDGESGGDEDATPLGKSRRNKPNGDPDSSRDGDGHGFRGHKHVSMSINKWAKPIPKLELHPRAHLHKASKIKQIWELWSMNVAVAMTTRKIVAAMASGLSPVLK